MWLVTLPRQEVVAIFLREFVDTFYARLALVYISAVTLRPLYFKRMFIENKRVQLGVKSWARHVLHCNCTLGWTSQTENNKGLASTPARASQTSKSLGRGLE